jgi:hypothetical protein
MVIASTWLMAGVIYRLLNIILDDDAAWYSVNDSPSDSTLALFAPLYTWLMTHRPSFPLLVVFLPLALIASRSDKLGDETSPRSRRRMNCRR